jgi:orotidine-5'-phosphate decarboxylase
MIDKLIEKIEETKNPIVVGLDPTIEMMPKYLTEEMYGTYGFTPEAVGAMFAAFNKEIIDRVYDLIPAVKPQIAMYERYGLEGIKAYIKTAEYAREKGLVVIGDTKRGDVATTAEAYATHIGGIEIEGRDYDLWKEDAITINPYFGTDGITPFVDECIRKDKGIFILIRTSNNSSFELQDLEVIGSDGKAEPLFYHVANMVGRWGENSIGKYNYSLVGAVVGATHKEQGIALRKQLPHTFFLVPGYGAQGGTGADLKGYFDKEGRGTIVNSSRGIIGAWKNNPDYSGDANLGKDFALASREAVIAMSKDLEQAI